MAKRPMRRAVFRIDYSDGMYSLKPYRQGDGQWGATIVLEGEDLKRWEAFLDEEAHWQNRFRLLDNAYGEEGEREECPFCKEWVVFEQDPRGWPYCPNCKGV